MSIFISIAAYRDPELVPTVRDCIAKARDPGSLSFGICWQHGPEEEQMPLLEDPRVRIVDVDWRQSHGTCWARSQIMQLYRGEDHFLQLDSHHRFAKHWDARLVDQLEDTASPRPVLTTYLPAYSLKRGVSRGREPTQIEFDGFSDDGILSLRPGIIPDWRGRVQPVRARFASAHFLFAPGRFVFDVPCDPELYFLGEETMLTVRAFTHGYDLFHPAEVVMWHEYSRSRRMHFHWTDHDAAHGLATEWHEYDRQSRAKVERFLEEPWIGPDGCGVRRTLPEYEAYAGVSFRSRRVQDYTRRAFEPPNPPAPVDWAERAHRWDVQIRIRRADIPVGAERAGFWYVGFHDAEGVELHRQDLVGAELSHVLAGGGQAIAFDRRFESDREPVSWVVWPCLDGQRWLEPLHGDVARTSRPPRSSGTGDGEPCRREPDEQLASDRDRDAIAEALRIHAVAGRIDSDELEKRVSIAFEARTLGELERAVADLPMTELARERARLGRPIARRGPTLALSSLVAAICVVVWLLSSLTPEPWPRAVLLISAALLGVWLTAKRS